MATVYRSVALLVGTSLLSMGARAANEAAKPDEPAELAEVVVSVERVTQTLQSYAGTAVTATQAELDSLGATNLVDIPSVLPGVEISNYEDNTNIYVRGIGSDANTELGDPAVAPHLDDVYVPRPRGLQVAFFDIDRVEVNVGPQGTIRGRNALGGTVNIVSKKPELNKFDGYAQVGYGNYDEKEYRGALNLPIVNDFAAARISVYSSNHDPFVRNEGLLRSLTGWESQDDVGGRAHLLVKPMEQWSILFTGDYLRSRGTGSRGVDFFQAAMAGINFNDVSDPRQVNQVGFNPTQDTRHWGMSLNTTYKTDFLNVQYIGAYRSLHYISDHPTGGRDYSFPGDDTISIERGGLAQPGTPEGQQYLMERVYGNYSALDWDTTSKEHTHELRFTSPDSADKLTWAAGLYYFREHQDVFLGIPQDYNTSIPYLEFNQGSTNGESKSGYADMTYALTSKWKVTAGARYSNESKDREGFNFIANLNTNGVAVRTGTPGFSFTGLSRALRNPDADGDGVPNTLADVVALYRAGIASYGVNDTLQTFLAGGCVQASAFGGTCANYPGLKSAGGGATVQHGQNSDKFVDWRARTQYDFTDQNMAYALVALGHKAPSFNDTVDADPAHPGTKLITPPVGPEKSMMVEVGSKNLFQVLNHPLVLNGSIYYVRYTDQVFSSQVGVAFLANDTAGQAACLDNNPNTPCPTVTLNQNVGKSRNIGFQLDSAYSLGHGVALAGTLLYQNTRYLNGSVVVDGRRGGPAGSSGSPLVDLSGNELPRTPPLTVNMRLNQAFAVPGGMADWVISGTYKTRQFLTAFNGGPGQDGSRDVTAVNATGIATAFGPEELRLYDKVNAYFHMDLGLGYTHEASNARVELYVNNVTDEAHATQASIDPGTQEFIFNPPRTYGVRLQVSF
ncbi:MAG: TonB-dependent receptor [Proteobacteria bacterium]|nr:TonB-dependent receptor [Pseudomonadota bacterium]